MSTSGALRTTRPGMLVPSDIRSVTDDVPSTTCALVRMRSGVTKNPLPRPPPASINTTAANAVPMMSSKEAGEATAGTGSVGASTTGDGTPGAGAVVASGGDSGAVGRAAVGVEVGGPSGIGDDDRSM